MKITFYYTTLLYLFFFTLPSCKKEEANDPNIIEKSYNVSVTDTFTIIESHAIKEIDLDGNGAKDLAISADYIDEGADTTVRLFTIQSPYGTGYGTLTDITTTTLGDIYLTRFITANTNINGLIAGFSSYSIVYARGFKGTTTFATFGSADGVDKLVGIKFKIGAADHYGWLRINMSSNGKTLTVKDGAYHKTAGAEIKAGSK
jgi:hypothetical protein